MDMKVIYEQADKYYAANKEFFHNIASRIIEAKGITIDVEELFNVCLGHYGALAIETDILPQAARKHYMQSILSCEMIDFIIKVTEERRFTSLIPEKFLEKQRFYFTLHVLNPSLELLNQVHGYHDGVEVIKGTI